MRRQPGSADLSGPEIADRPVRQRVLALIPSAGLGGGIESYVRAVVEALETSGAEVLPLIFREGPDSTISFADKVRYARKVMRAAHGQQRIVVIAFHAALAPLAALARRSASEGTKAFVVQHGHEVWTAGIIRRRWDTARGLHHVAVSSFSAGALAARASANVLHPGIPRTRYERLVASGAESGARRGLRVLSAFRLVETESKGGYCLVEACRLARETGEDLSLVIAGRGPAPARLKALESATPWLTVLESPTDEELDRAFRAAGLFILATRTRRERRDPSGEGFGIVLIEAALAGLPVIAPASGGSLDAYLDRLTGVRPVNESPEALAGVLASLGSRPVELERLGRNGRAWARTVFDPDSYATRAAEVFLGQPDHRLPEIHVENERGSASPH